MSLDRHLEPDWVNDTDDDVVVEADPDQWRDELAARRYTRPEADQ